MQGDHIIPFEHRPLMSEQTCLPKSLTTIIEDLAKNDDITYIVDLMSSNLHSIVFKQEVSALSSKLKNVTIRYSVSSDHDNSIFVEYPEKIDVTDVYFKREFISKLQTLEIPLRFYDPIQTFLMDTYTMKPKSKISIDDIENGHFLFEVGDEDVIIEGNHSTVTINNETKLGGLIKCVGTGNITIRNLNIDAFPCDVTSMEGLLVSSRSSFGSIRIENCHLKVRSMEMGSGGFVGSENTNITISGSSVSIRSSILSGGGGLVGSLCMTIDITDSSVHMYRGLLHEKTGGLVGVASRGKCTITRCKVSMDGNVHAKSSGGLLPMSSSRSMSVITESSVFIGGHVKGDGFGGLMGSGTKGNWTIRGCTVDIMGDFMSENGGGLCGTNVHLNMIDTSTVTYHSSINGDYSGGLVGKCTNANTIRDSHVVINGDVNGTYVGGIGSQRITVRLAIQNCTVQLKGSVTSVHVGGLFGRECTLCNISGCSVVIGGNIMESSTYGLVGDVSSVPSIQDTWVHVKGNVHRDTSNPSILFGIRVVITKVVASTCWFRIDGIYKLDGDEQLCTDDQSIKYIHAEEDAISMFETIGILSRQYLISTFKMVSVTFNDQTYPVFHPGIVVSNSLERGFVNVYEKDHIFYFDLLPVTYATFHDEQPLVIGSYEITYQYGGVLFNLVEREMTEEVIGTVEENKPTDEVGILASSEAIVDETNADTTDDTVVGNTDVDNQQMSSSSYGFITICIITGIILLFIIAMLIWWY